VRNDQHSAAAAGAPPAPAAPAAAEPAPRGRLFRRYFFLVVALVTVSLLVPSSISLWFSYQETLQALHELQQEKANGAASRIEQYIVNVHSQLRGAALPQLGADAMEQRKLEFLKLLTRVPEVTDVAYIAPDGCEQLHVSRLEIDRADECIRNRAAEPVFREPVPGQPYYGPVYFKKDTEPYMPIAVRSGGAKGPVAVADVNLKFMWDVVTRIRIGEEGKVYVVDKAGFLIAHPDIGRVLQKQDLSQVPHVKRALEAVGDAHTVGVTRDADGTEVLSSYAPIATLGWRVFAEQPAKVVLSRLYESLARTGVLLLGGLAISALAALFLARGMVRPIRAMQESAQLIGEGQLDHRLDIRTGDELETLASQFNRMTARLAESYASLERKVDERTHELSNALDQQTAISDILRVISSSPTDVQPVLEAVAERAAQLCEAPFARVMLVQGDELAPRASYTDPRHTMTIPGYPVPLDRSSISGRAAVDRKTVHIADVLPVLDAEFFGARDNILAMRIRAALAVPLMREGGAYGAIFLFRSEPRAFAADQIALVETFARQAAIAIDNVRLFNETRDALERQTAIGEVLRVITASPTDVRPVVEAVAERALRLCDADDAQVLVAEGGRLGSVVLGGGPGEDARGESFAVDRSFVAGRAFVDRAAVSVDDLLAPDAARDFPEGNRLALEMGFRTVVAVPLMREAVPVGVMTLRRRNVRPFDARAVALLQTFADQAAIAIENVRLFNETREALEHQKASGEVLAAISSSIADTAPVFERILASCERLFEGRLAVITLVGEDGAVHLGAYHGPGREELERMYPLPLDETTATGRAVLRREFLHYADVAADPDVPARAREGWTAGGMRAAMVAPMLWKGAGIGSIHVMRDFPGAFSDKEIALLRTFADQAAIAIENARLIGEIQDKSRQLEIANKHKSEFLANMSHELRTPLNAIIGFSEVLIERMFGELNDKQDDYLKDILASGRHLLALINDILDLAKVEAGRMELEPSRFHIPTAIDNAMTLVRERAQRHGIALGHDIEASLDQIFADERKFKQILVNLLTNAVKFTPDGGSVDVLARRAGDVLEVAVRDTGIGIAPEDHQAVFEEFRQVGRHYTNKQEGTGLGLSLTRRFVELHGGTMRLESEPGRGSTFSFTIPFRAEDAQEGEA